jgi:hypothetical protein
MAVIQEGDMGQRIPTMAMVASLRGNPLDEIRNLRSIESVWIAGNRLQKR